MMNWTLAAPAISAAFLASLGEAVEALRFRGRYWDKSGHELLHRTCLLLTQSGHLVALNGNFMRSR